MIKKANSKVVVSYRCPSCSKSVFGIVTVLSLFGDKMVLKCSECGNSSMTITKTGDSKLRFDYPCILCESNHNSIIPLTAILSRDLITMPCDLCGFDALFIGKENYVAKAVVETDEAVFNYLESITPEDIAENKGDGETTDQSLVTMLITALEDMEVNGKIHCGCTKGKYSLTINDDNLDLRCQKCNRHLRIYTTFGNVFAYDVLWRDEVYLEEDDEEDEGGDET